MTDAMIKDAGLRWTDIVEFDAATRTATTVLRVLCQDGTVRFEGDDELAGRLAVHGAYSPAEGRIVVPPDGVAFLAALEHEFRDPHFFATSMRAGVPEPIVVPEPRDVPPDRPRPAA